MKRFYTLVVALVASIATLSAQQPTKWAVGVRGGCDAEVIVRYTGLGEVAGKPMYLEGRFGTILAYASEFTPEGTAIAAWECAKFGESQVGDFSFDAGVAVSAGGWSPTDCWVLAGPMMRVDYTFDKAPYHWDSTGLPAWVSEAHPPKNFRHISLGQDCYTVLRSR